MSILPVLVLVSLLVAGGAVLAFFWAVEHDQFEDLRFPAFLPLLDPPPRAEGPAAAPADSAGPPAPQSGSIETPGVPRS